MRITRRQLGGLLAAAPAAARRSVRVAGQPQASGAPGQSPQAAADDLRKSAGAVRRLAIPAETEPAFSFRVE
jgi:hypothetical protein